MGQKVHPIGFRVGVTQGWKSTWYADKEYGRYVKEDFLIRQHVNAKASSAGISKVVIERAANKAKVFVHAAKPGMIQGRGGRGRESLRNELQKLASTEVFLNIMDVRKIDTDAMWVAENIGAQLAKRVSFRRAMKKAITQSMRSGAKGIKVMCSGRLGGAEMSRTEWYREGRVPLHTLRANIDYGLCEAKTSYGIIGVKVWIFKGEILPGDDATARPRT